jgi:hypothetical protein
VCYVLLADTLKYITCLGGAFLTVPLLSGRSNIEEYFNALKYDGVVLTWQKERVLRVLVREQIHISIFPVHKHRIF